MRHGASGASGERRQSSFVRTWCAAVHRVRQAAARHQVRKRDMSNLDCVADALDVWDEEVVSVIFEEANGVCGGAIGDDCVGLAFLGGGESGGVDLSKQRSCCGGGVQLHDVCRCLGGLEPRLGAEGANSLDVVFVVGALCSL